MRRITQVTEHRAHNTRPETSSAAADYFGRYKRETYQSIRTATVRENKELARLVKVWDRYLSIFKAMNKDKNRGAGVSIDHPELVLYRIASAVVGDISYPTKLIELFCLRDFQELLDIRKLEDNKFLLGAFLSALINAAKSSKFTLSTNHLDSSPDSLGTLNAKYLLISGDAGDFLGQLMQGGRILVTGNAGDWIGEGMEGGEIVIEKNVGSSAGAGMHGGRIVVNGNAGSELGVEMRGGEIIVKGDINEGFGYSMYGGTISIEGNYGSLPDHIEGGNIFHKGRQIVKDGKLV
ncbi:hypothetical protein J4450_07665 [Candidatus Micrarchaeota archaeon]|nr:hypothetical protein [Candidatus Micrarchaeota archaeon]